MLNLGYLDIVNNNRRVSLWSTDEFCTAVFDDSLSQVEALKVIIAGFILAGDVERAKQHLDDIWCIGAISTEEAEVTKGNLLGNGRG